MKLIIIRHGESEADLLDVFEGKADFNLTEKGHRQAEAMAEVVSKRYKIDRLYCSSLKRAYQTAMHLSEKIGIEPEQKDMLREFNNGLLAGMDKKLGREMYPAVDVPPHASVYEQESALEYRFRAEYILSEILSENPMDSTVAIVSHGGFIGRLYRAFLRLPENAGIMFPTGFTAFHEWTVTEKRRVVNFANLQEHIKGIE